LTEDTKMVSYRIDDDKYDDDDMTDERGITTEARLPELYEKLMRGIAITQVDKLSELMPIE
jgi:hypothetical protein